MPRFTSVHHINLFSACLSKAQTDLLILKDRRGSHIPLRWHRAASLKDHLRPMAPEEAITDCGHDSLDDQRHGFHYREMRHIRIIVHITISAIPYWPAGIDWWQAGAFRDGASDWALSAGINQRAL